MSAETFQPFICGGTAACLASATIHPIDLSKVRLQLFATLNPGVPKPNFVQILTNLVKEEGISAMYAGLSASLMRQAVYGTARIGTGFHTKGNVFFEKLIAVLTLQYARQAY